MADFFAMHGYAAYVWPAYAVFAIVLIADALTPLFARRRVLREIDSRQRRAASRKPT
ncbi:MAG: heme exporter protein CcmD [Proteobacteria bacterium]|nr:heme exporter protein CcmD [Pseudomonadota bacterium]